MKSIMMKLFNPEEIIKSKKFEMINAETAAEITRKTLEFREGNRIFELRHKIQEAALEGHSHITLEGDEVNAINAQLLRERGFVLSIPFEDHLRISWKNETN
jgi:hypothetical protein